MTATAEHENDDLGELLACPLPLGRFTARYADGTTGPVEVITLSPGGPDANGDDTPAVYGVHDPMWRGPAIGARVSSIALPVDWIAAGHKLAPAWPAWLLTALGEVGTAEIRGGEDPRIMEYHHAIADGQDEDEDAWCAAFVGWVMKAHGYPLPKGPASARSWLTFGAATPDPIPGAIAVLWRGKRDSWQGHVGFIVAARDGFVWLLGGNQSDSVCIQRFPRAQVLGFRLPV